MGSLVGVIFCARVALCASESVNALQGVEYGVTDWMRMMQLKVIKMTMKMMLMKIILKRYDYDEDENENDTQAYNSEQTQQWKEP